MLDPTTCYDIVARVEVEDLKAKVALMAKLIDALKRDVDKLQASILLIRQTERT